MHASNSYSSENCAQPGQCTRDGSLGTACWLSSGAACYVQTDSSPLRRGRRGSTRWLKPPNGACLTILPMTSRAPDMRVTRSPLKHPARPADTTVHGRRDRGQCTKILCLPASTEGVEEDDELLPGDSEPFQPGMEVEQALRTLESGGQLPPQPVYLRTGRCI